MSVATNLTAELEPVRAMLAADGYDLAAALSADGRTIVLDITATAEACAECLAPPTVIAAVARSCFSETSALAGREIDVRLPIHAGGTDSPPGRHAGPIA
jgi:DeoR/GlpR family transcriptional regulator of sugar metabolism